ncbi:MAG: IS701 family transposase [Gammaproteobacteria bacterium]
MVLSRIESPQLSASSIMSSIEQELIGIQDILQDCFTRAETKKSAAAYFNGLISSVERKNSWQLAEQAGCESPYAFQYLLGRATWDVNCLRDASCTHTINFMGSQESVLSIDETGFLKKGDKSVGVGRQYTGTAGRIENCQVGVFLSYATSHGRALIDRELYIPQDWFEDRTRCKEAGIPDYIEFKTKPVLAQDMLRRALENDIKPSWVVGDEVYGCYALRAFLEKHQQSYILSVASNTTVTIGFEQYRVKQVLERIEPSAWQTLSAGNGSKGKRHYQWVRIVINSDSPEGWERWLLLRRNIKDPTDIAFYIAFSHQHKSLQEMAKAAGSRWTIEECFEMAKGEVGLDEYEVRSWTGWYRHITFSMLALSFLVKLRWQFNQNELQLLKKRKKSRMKLFLRSRG